jgi:voltage-gated potassium channel
MFERSFLTHFFQHFLRVVWYLRSLYMALIGSILVGGFAIAAIEKIPFGDAVYFAFITGLTVGYGDVVAHTGVGRFISVLLGFIGIIFTGLVVGGATHAVDKAWHEIHGRK